MIVGMYEGKRFVALLLMGGEGARFGSGMPKQFHRIAGKKIYMHTLGVFSRVGVFDEILLVCHKDWVEEVRKEVTGFANVRVVEGGSCRQESSFLGLKRCETDFVVIHDAVRPFVSEEIIKNNVESVLKYGAVNTCIKSTDTIVYSEDRKIISSIPDRSCCFRGQTPQSFEYGLILEAHIKTNQKNATDDCSLVKHPIYLVEGSESNIKITTQLDLFLAEQLLYLNKKKIDRDKEVSLRGKKFAVVGGSGGIGKSLCDLLKKEGATVIPISRSLSKTDLNSPESIKETFERIFKEEGKLDGLINSAGIFRAKALEELGIEEIEEMVRVNLTGLIYACKMAKIKEEGHIVNIASSSFSKGRKNSGVYSATKAAVVNFTQALAEERESLKVNVVVPQRTNTKMRRANFPYEDSKELLEPEEVAKAIVNLLKNREITGSIIEVRLEGLEPSTHSLKGNCSTTELKPHNT